MSITEQKSPNNLVNNSRFTIENLADNTVNKDDGKDVINGLKSEPKTLSPRYFYDAKGSQLFEKICQLREYYPTRTEASILEQYASEISTITGKVELIELGSGSSTKTRYLLDAYQALDYPLTYIPIDVSGSILKESANSLLQEYPNLTIKGKVGTYHQCLNNIQATDKQPKMVLFLGSSIGNFNHQECDRFIDLVTSSIHTGDYFLLGIDLQKPKNILEAAYNDSQGVTAAFNLNILQHLNHKFQGDFDRSLFKHQAIYNTSDHQIEMYLISHKAHTATLKALDLTVSLAKEETIRTEISRKFDIEKMSQYLAGKGLTLSRSFTDLKNWFGLLLFQKKQVENL